MEFKEKAAFISKEEIYRYYELLADVHIKRDTDLNSESISRIINSIVGESVLDVGSGRGFLVKIIAEKLHVRVTGVDMFIPDALSNTCNATFIAGFIEDLPFADKSFDTVICSHTLEHVQNLELSIKELRRVAKKRLIVVVPKQREYKYTFDLHIHFFPYIFSLKKVMKNEDSIYETLGNDFIYIEDMLS